MTLCSLHCSKWETVPAFMEQLSCCALQLARTRSLHMQNAGCGSCRKAQIGLLCIVASLLMQNTSYRCCRKGHINSVIYQALFR